MAPPTGGGRSALVWSLVRAAISLACGWLIGMLFPHHAVLGVLACCLFLLVLFLITPPQLINLRRRGCTICGERPALPAPTGEVKPKLWFYPHERIVVEYVCVKHLYTWLKLRTVVDAD
jgi:hypothetical protein